MAAAGGRKSSVPTTSDLSSGLQATMQMQAGVAPPPLADVLAIREASSLSANCFLKDSTNLENVFSCILKAGSAYGT